MMLWADAAVEKSIAATNTYHALRTALRAMLFPFRLRQRPLDLRHRRCAAAYARSGQTKQPTTTKRNAETRDMNCRDGPSPTPRGNGRIGGYARGVTVSMTNSCKPVRSGDNNFAHGDVQQIGWIKPATQSPRRGGRRYTTGHATLCVFCNPGVVVGGLRERQRIADGTDCERSFLDGRCAHWHRSRSNCRPQRDGQLRPLPVQCDRCRKQRHPASGRRAPAVRRRIQSGNCRLQPGDAGDAGRRPTASGDSTQSRLRLESASR